MAEKDDLNYMFMDAFKSHSHSDAQKWKAILKNIQSLSNQWECVFSTISSVLLFTKMMLFTENSLTLIASHLFALTWSFSKFFLLFVCLFFLQLGVLLISGKLT